MLGAATLTAEADRNGHAASDCAAGSISIDRLRGHAVWIVAFGEANLQRVTPAPETAPVAVSAPVQEPVPVQEPAPAQVPVPAPIASEPEHTAREPASRAVEPEQAPPEPPRQVQDAPHNPDTVQPELFPELAAAPAPLAVIASDEWRHPLRFVWQLDPDGRFTINSAEFIAIMGPLTAALFRQPWPFIASAMNVDPEGQVARAIETRGTWSGVLVQWPVDGGDQRLPVELSGLPVFDRERTFRGYRGFGVCRDVAGLNAMLQARRAPVAPAAAELPSAVLPPEVDAPGLSPVERYAFYELSRQLTSRINEADAQARLSANDQCAPEAHDVLSVASDAQDDADAASAGNARPFLERLPIGVLIYRLSHLLYANKAFLDWAGNDSLDELAEAGGLDSLMIESGDIAIEQDGRQAFSIASLTDEKNVVEARLLQVPWEGEAAFALLTMPPGVEPSAQASLDALRAELAESQRDPRYRHGWRDRARSRCAHPVGEPQRTGVVRLRRARARRTQLRRAVRAGEHRHRHRLSRPLAEQGRRGAARRRKRDRRTSSARVV